MIWFGVFGKSRIATMSGHAHIAGRHHATTYAMRPSGRIHHSAAGSQTNGTNR